MDSNVQLVIDTLVKGTLSGVSGGFIIWFSSWVIPQIIQFFKDLTR